MGGGHLRGAAAAGIAALLSVPLAIMVLGALHAPGDPPPVGLKIVLTAPSLGAFERAANLVPLWRRLANSVTVVAIAVPLTVAVASTTGFAMSRLRGRAHLLAIGSRWSA